MSSKKNSGKRIKEFRLESKKTQAELAKELSRQTGEKIDAKAVSRMENYGANDACHPLAPSPAVNAYIDSAYTPYSIEDNASRKHRKHKIRGDVNRGDLGNTISSGQNAHFPHWAGKDESIEYEKNPNSKFYMERHYYVRDRLRTVEQLDGVVAIKSDPATRSQIPLGLSNEQLHVTQEELEVFRNAGWVFSEAAEYSNSQRGSFFDEAPLANVFRRPEDGSIIIGTKVLTVQLQKEFTPEVIQTKLEKERLSIRRKLKFAPNLYEVIVSADVDPIDEANKLHQNKNDFIFAEPVMIEYISRRCDQENPDENRSQQSNDSRPTDPYYKKQWQWSNDGVNGISLNADVRAEIAWKHSRGRNVRVAVIDNSFDVRHEDLQDGVADESGYFLDNDKNDFIPGLRGYPTPRYGDFHGTFCAGMIGARANNGVGGCGIAPESEMLLIVSQPDQVGTQNTLARAIAYAADPSTEDVESRPGADIISCSMGWSDGRPWIMETVLELAINYAIREGRGGKGTSIFWATSNNNVDLSVDEVCSHPNVISVGRSNSSDLADGSAHGDIDFLAPGKNVYSTMPNNQYDNKTGTSFSAPCAAGVAALLLSINPDLSADRVRQILQDTCDKVGEVTYGNNGHHPDYGYGRINATRAINEILRPIRTSSLGILSICYASVVTIFITLST
jgi:subtilisin family serine protease